MLTKLYWPLLNRTNLYKPKLNTKDAYVKINNTKRLSVRWWPLVSVIKKKNNLGNLCFGS
jgi:hypothetical protein